MLTWSVEQKKNVSSQFKSQLTSISISFIYKQLAQVITASDAFGVEEENGLAHKTPGGK